MNNKLPQVHLVFNRKKTASLTRTASVEIRVTYNYKQKFLSTGVRLYSNQWKNGKIVNCSDIIQISQILDRMLSKIRRSLLEMLDKGNIDLTTLSLGDEVDNAERMTFLDFCSKRAAIRKYGKQKDTQERYDRFLKHLEGWGKIKYFDDINDSNIIAYDEYLKKSGMKAYSKWNNYHRFLSGFITDALEEKYIQRNPYKWVNIDKEKKSLGLDRCLTLEEFKNLKKTKMPTESLERVRDLFIFQTYTCLRYSDLRKFDSNNIITINGTKVYKCIQKKTKKGATIPLLKPALDILDKYNGTLPIISNVKYNLYLKNVAQAVGLDIGLSTHWARHTGATILLNEGVDMKIVTKVCGHSSMRITEQIYAKLLDETVVKEVQKVEGNI